MKRYMVLVVVLVSLLTTAAFAQKAGPLTGTLITVVVFNGTKDTNIYFSNAMSPDCIKRYSFPDPYAPPSHTASGYITADPEGGAFERCGWAPSDMFIAIKPANGRSIATLRLVKPPGHDWRAWTESVIPDSGFRVSVHSSGYPTFSIYITK